jgi:hypothetical protein
MPEPAPVTSDTREFKGMDFFRFAAIELAA